MNVSSSIQFSDGSMRVALDFDKEEVDRWARIGFPAMTQVSEAIKLCAKAARVGKAA